MAPPAASLADVQASLKTLIASVGIISERMAGLERRVEDIATLQTWSPRTSASSGSSSMTSTKSPGALALGSWASPSPRLSWRVGRRRQL